MLRHLLSALSALTFLAMLACGFTDRAADPDQNDPQEVVISPGPGGEPNVQVGGQNTWPPTGPDCDRYVACCDAARQISSSADLFCRLSLADQTFTCTSGIGEVRNYLTELGNTPPPACSP